MRESWWVRESARGRLGALGFDTVPGAMAATAEATPLSSDRQSEAHRLDADPVVLVKWRRVRAGRFVRGLLRASRERNEAFASLRARALGIPCPEPLAVGERRHHGFLVGAVLVREFLADHSVVDARVDVAALARTFRAWHDAGFRHGACYPKNVLVSRRGDEFVPVGCTSVTFAAPGFRLDAARRKDLAQIASGLLDLRPGTDPLAFLRAYAPERDLAPWVRPRFRRLQESRRRRTQAQPAFERPKALAPDTTPVRRRVRPLPSFDADADFGATVPAPASVLGTSIGLR